ncbi:MAG TPA: hypothetical protein V6C52_15265 [Coleofasciculaceae cyanobacterium]
MNPLQFGAKIITFQQQNGQPVSRSDQYSAAQYVMDQEYPCLRPSWGQGDQHLLLSPQERDEFRKRRDSGENLNSIKQDFEQNAGAGIIEIEMETHPAKVGPGNVTVPKILTDLQALLDS